LVTLSANEMSADMDGGSGGGNKEMMWGQW
jgi:hypothetical protein